MNNYFEQILKNYIIYKVKYEYFVLINVQITLIWISGIVTCQMATHGHMVLLQLIFTKFRITKTKRFHKVWSSSAYPFPYASCVVRLWFPRNSWPHEDKAFSASRGAMKKRLELQEQQPQDLEIMKAVAQARYSHSASSRPMSEFDAHRRDFKGKPSRFKVEAMGNKSSTRDTSPATHWDFQKSLWDSYELVTVSRRIEIGLALDNPFDDSTGSIRIQRRRKQESKNSLRNLFNNLSSRRFNATKVPQENDTWASSCFIRMASLIYSLFAQYTPLN